MGRKLFIAGFAAVFLLAPSLSFAQTCPTGMNKAEIGTRYLVTEFMVAALSCKNDAGFRDSYGSFVRRYNSGLVGNGQAMKAYFGGSSALDSYVTRLANHAALRQNDGAYCSHARMRLDRALAAGKTATLSQVIDNLGYSLGGPACGDMTPVAALASKSQIGAGKIEPAKAAPAKATPATTPTVSEPDKAGEAAAAAPPMPAPGGGSELSPTP